MSDIFQPLEFAIKFAKKLEGKIRVIGLILILEKGL